MREGSRLLIPAEGVRSLVWQGDELFDPAGGWRRFSLDGKQTARKVFYAYGFDRALLSAGGVFSALYTALATKALLLKGGRTHRELNRSYYCASSYEYPISFLTLPNGSEAVVHCPDEYCRLEIERAETGERMTSRSGDPRDFFHSRLQVSPGSRYLLSAGWIWHPWDSLAVYDLEAALVDPGTLDGRGILPRDVIEAEVQSAVFLDHERILVATGEETLDKEWEEAALGPRELGVWSLRQERWVSRAAVAEPVGTMMPLGEYVVSFYDHPKLIQIATGEVTERWRDIRSGRQDSSIIARDDRIPPIAMDAEHQRFAVAGDDVIAVVQLGR